MRTLLARAKTEMTLGLAVSGTSKQENAFPCRGQLSELVKSKSGALCLMNAVLSSLGEFEGADLESLRQFKETGVVGDGANDGDDAGEFVVTLVGWVGVILEMFGDARNRDGVAIESRLVESLLDDLIELCVGPAGEEGVKLTRLIYTLIRLWR